MGTLQRFNLALLKKQSGINTLYETGTDHGNSLRWAYHCGLEHLTSIEQDAATLEIAKTNLKGIPAVLILGDTMKLITAIEDKTNEPRLFFLDAHFVGGADFKPGVASYIESAKDPRSFPLLEELEVLAKKILQTDWVIIDDARLYSEEAFALGECPEWARQWEKRPQLERCFKLFATTHNLHLLRQDHGYFVLTPKAYKHDLRDVVRVQAGDPAGNGQIQIVTAIPGVTSISIQRRIADHRFATRYFTGQGIDVGGGIDSLAVFQEFFPRIQTVTNYDTASGDAQLLKNVDDNTFDFLYSSHCLEHMRSASESLRNWIRVVKPDGHLVVQVPDEDLYEQGVWPSRYNSDHKITFTIHKTKSWSPVSVNVLDLLGEFADQVRILSVGLIDHGYRYGLRSLKFDQTRTPLAECGIEFVLKKL